MFNPTLFAPELAPSIALVVFCRPYLDLFEEHHHPVDQAPLHPKPSPVIDVPEKYDIKILSCSDFINFNMYMKVKKK